MPPRRRPLGRSLLLAAGLGAALVACVDLFHSTSFQTACDLDASACADVSASSTEDAALPDVALPDAGFCAWDAVAALKNARHACAWLGACAGPVGGDAFGPCMVRATLAYDCAANPNRPVRGAAYAFWDRLWRAQSCADVLGAVEPSKTVSCAPSSSAYGACDTDTHLECSADGGSPLGIENCAAVGQTCAAATASTAACSGPASCSGGDAGAFCANGAQLEDCDPDGGGDHGVNCASFGAGSCASGACQAVGGQPCPPTSLVTCAGDVATGCPSGVQETLDCRAVLGVAGSCNASAAGRPWDVSRACSVGAGTCPPDSCADGKTLSSCAQGATISLDCTTVGLSGCVSAPGALAACASP